MTEGVGLPQGPETITLGRYSEEQVTATNEEEQHNEVPSEE